MWCRFGIGNCLLVFSALLAIGQSVVVYGLFIQSWKVIFLGRFIFGLGGENLSVATSCQVSEWFLGGELAFAFGVNLSVAKMASVANDFLSPMLATYFDGVHVPALEPTASKKGSNIGENGIDDAADVGAYGVIYAAAFGAFLCLLSFLSVFIYIRIERYVDSHWDDKGSVTRHGDYRAVDTDSSTHARAYTHGTNLLAPPALPAIAPVDHMHTIESGNRQNISEASRLRLAGEDSTKVVYGTHSGSAHDKEPEQRSELMEVFKFPLILWMLFLSCFVVYGT
jgi:hypothetical protein